jgi:4-hydroxyphenylpyruvate dioxygenase
MGTKYEKKGEAPKEGKFKGFDHVHFYVSNAKQVADWYCLRLGFQHVAYRGLETGSRDYATHVVRQDRITFAFSSPLLPKETEMGRDIFEMGDMVKDIAFEVADCEALYKKAIARGGEGVKEPETLKDEDGEVIVATVKTYGKCWHTFVQRNGYKGVFMPGYKAVEDKDPLAKLIESPKLNFIDHCVGNQPDQQMVPAADWYEKVLDFHRFWSVDDKQMHTKYSALRSIVVTDWDEKVKMPLNEPAAGVRKSQIQEYVDYHGGAGVQHIAMNTSDILHTISNLRSRGVDFLRVPKEYYEDLRKRLSKSPVKVLESLDEIERLNILVDFDDKGYLLQLFTRCVEDRPTLFFEVIQRHNHQGFGAGNFKALFEAIEREQEERGNLTADAPPSGGFCSGGGGAPEPTKKKHKTSA